MTVEKRANIGVLCRSNRQRGARLEKRQSAVGELRFDFSSRGMRFKRNRTGFVLRQRDGGREGPIGIDAALENPVILMAQFEACPLA
jgi:hypothetical protein